jgi:hypothetical protein
MVKRSSTAGFPNWAVSKVIGRTSEIAVLTPITPGCIPGERRTYEERAISVIESLAAQHEHGLPTVLGTIPAIHFGRIVLIRPEQYLLYSNADGIDYFNGHIPKPIDDYEEIGGAIPNRRADPKDGPVEFRSFLLTLVEFDGDLKVYFRDIAVFLAQSFDAIFENCDDYPGTQDFELFWLWIRRYQISTQLFYATYPNLSVVRIKQLEEFKRRFDAFVARVRPPSGRGDCCLDDLFDEFLRDNEQIAFDFPTPGGTYEPNGRADRSV